MRTVEDLQCYGERELIEEIQTLERRLEQESLPEQVRASIKRMVDYSYEDEKKHFEEAEETMSEDNSQRSKHIFKDIKRVTQWLAGIREPKKMTLKIPITASDAEDLLNAQEFHWTFPTEETGEDVDVHLYFDDGYEDEYDGEEK